MSASNAPGRLGVTSNGMSQAPCGGMVSGWSSFAPKQQLFPHVYSAPTTRSGRLVRLRMRYAY
jgi:hypothetical protein